MGALYGQGATDRVVLERALGIEAQLRKLAVTGSEPTGRRAAGSAWSRSTSGSGPLSARLLGSFVVTALTHLSGRRRPGAARAMAAHARTCSARNGSATTSSTGSPTSARTPVPGWCSPTGRCRRRSGSGSAGGTLRRVHAAGQRGGREGGQRADRDRTPVRPLPAHRDRRDVGDGHDRRLVHEHGRRLGLAGYIDRRIAVDLGGTGYSHGGRRGFLPFGGGPSRSAETGRSQRDERVGLANRRDQHEHGLGGVHLAGDRGQRVARPLPAALAGVARRSRRSYSGCRSPR